MSARAPWDSYAELAAQVEGRSPGTGDTEVDRFYEAGEYANWSTPTDVTDEEWAEAFWSGWHSIVDNAAPGGSR